MTVPADITPGGCYVLVIAGQLRDGTHADDVPGYDVEAWKDAIARAVAGLTFQPARLRTDSRAARGTRSVSPLTA